MKFKVWEQEEKTEQVAVLRLLSVGDEVGLYVVDEDGKPKPGGHLATLDGDVLWLTTDVNQDLGLPLDKNGSIKILPGNTILRNHE